jgi:hypothetical protein
VTENEDLVPLEGPGDWKVRRQWTWTRGVPRSKSGGRVDEWDAWVHDADVAMKVHMVGTEARPTYIEIHPLGEDLTVELLNDIDWAATMNWVVLWEAMEQRMGEADADLVSRSQRTRYHDSIEWSMKLARRKNGVTKERLTEVLQLYEAGGIEAVTEKTGKSRSYAYQLLARARKEIK